MTDPDPANDAAEDAAYNYTVVSLFALVVLTSVLLQFGVGIWCLLPVVVGLVAVGTHWRAGPPLVLVSSACLLFMHRTGMDPMYDGDPVGRWEGDTLVIDSTNFKRWQLDDYYYTNPKEFRTHSDALHTIERYRRTSFGTMDVTLTIDDPKAYTRPWTVSASPARLIVGQDLLEYVCTENNRDVEHLFGGQK